jgi:hypothetical protein
LSTRIRIITPPPESPFPLPCRRATVRPPPVQPTGDQQRSTGPKVTCSAPGAGGERLRRALADDGADQAEAEDVTDVRRLLYGLDAILRLHNAQEEEGAFSLVPDARKP